KRTGLGVTYLLFFFTGVPAILGVIEALFMPARVRRYNFERATMLAASVRGLAGGFSGQALPGPAGQAAATRHCSTCGEVVAEGVRFCAKCGAPVL
ncbi:MAG TPA: zinc ribbon domain-containing protein, partial [Acidobacteriaceae bacterium]